MGVLEHCAKKEVVFRPSFAINRALDLCEMEISILA
jgi:hypothetical protein